MAKHEDRLLAEPTLRKLRIFALDPSLAAQHDTAGISEITINIPWEAKLEPGPIGEYIEVVDADPASACFYEPVDLNDRRVLAQDGLSPSETNPQFHQQMVYAVAMATIQHFELALGRVALWSSHEQHDAGAEFTSRFVRRLRIYPHAIRERNAYYSPLKKALLFGYFPAGITDANNARDAIIFTSLSHDIVAHETTHALLDGVHPRFNEPVNPDVLAFHEAFADIVALFQHFSYPGVLRHQIAQTRGDLAGNNLLAQLARQFGLATGHREALRNAIEREPNVQDIATECEPHARGAILVAAVFRAFLKVYRARTADLVRIASEGTGVLRAGEIHPDLANRMADEAARCALYILQMCIRAVDYCPPVGITFGDYLRALVTADFDFNPEDPYGYRLAVVESFRQWGIHPKGMSSISVEALLWPSGESAMDGAKVNLAPEEMRALFVEPQTVMGYRRKSSKYALDGVLRPWNLDSDRYRVWADGDVNARILWAWLMGKGRRMLPALGLVVDDDHVPPTVYRSRREPHLPSVEVHSVRTALRRSSRGATVTDLVVEITQRRRGYFDADVQRQKDAGVIASDDTCDFRYRAGCTLLIDPVTMGIRRVIRTPGTVTDNAALERMRHFLVDGGLASDNSFWLPRAALCAREPFAMLHRHAEG